MSQDNEDELVQRQEQVRSAFKKAGGVSRWARFFGINRTSIYEWIEKGEVPEKRAVIIETESSRLVTRPELRPGDYWEVWPELRPKRQKG